MKEIKILPSTVNRIFIEKRPNNEFSVTIEIDNKRTYYQGHNKTKDTYTTKCGFTAVSIQDIIAYAKELDKE